MDDLVLVALTGLLASLVDGALGMGFGPISASVLLGGGLAPAAAAATINIAKVASGVAAGLSHWRFGNIDRALVLRLALPGMAGAVIGGTVLAWVDGAVLRPLLAVLLLLVALRMLLRFSRPLPAVAGDEGGERQNRAAVARHGRGIATAGFAGGITNGLVGAWGPVVTPALLRRGITPRHAIGSVNTAEIAVAFTAVGSLFTAAGSSQIDAAIVAAMLGGSIVAAPIAAWVIRFLPARALGLAVAGLLLATNVRELASWAGVSGLVGWLLLGGVALLTTAAAVRPWADARWRNG